MTKKLLLGFQYPYWTNTLNMKNKTKMLSVLCVWSNQGVLFSELFNLERGKCIVGQFILFYNSLLNKEIKCFRGPN